MSLKVMKVSQRAIFSSKTTKSRTFYQPLFMRYSIKFWIINHNFCITQFPAGDQNGEKLLNETGQLWRILLSAAMDPAASDVVCVLDALDECANEGQQDLISFLVDFYNSRCRRHQDNHH
jgi:hypothetical protein